MSGTVHLAAARAVPRPRAQAVLLLAIFVLAAVLRLYHLGETSLWTDEFFTEFYPKTGLGFMWGQGLRLEPTPPLYNSMILLTERVFGETPFLLRFPSLIGSMAGIVLAGLLARELFGSGASMVGAVLLLALCPTDIFYAQEARAYALQGAALALALLGFARVLREPNSVPALGLYALGAALAIYFHLTSVLAVAAINLAFLAGLVGRTPLLGRRALWPWLGANALIGLACLPLAPAVLSSSTATATVWIPAITRWSVESVIGVTLFGPALTGRAMMLAEVGVVAVAVLLILPPWRPGRRALLVLALVPAVFLALMIGISLKKPILLSRTVAWLWIPLAVMLGDLVARRGRLIGAGVLALFLVGAGLHLSEVDTLKENWKGLLARLPALGAPTLVVLAPTSSPAALALYAPEAGQAVILDDGLPEIVESTVVPAMFGTPRMSFAKLRETIQSGRPVWVVTRRALVEYVEQATAGLPSPKAIVTEGEGTIELRAMRW